MAELGYAAGFTASDALESPRSFTCLAWVLFHMGRGSYIPNSIYCNVGRCMTGEAGYREAEILCDIAGGITGDLPA